MEKIAPHLVGPEELAGRAPLLGSNTPKEGSPRPPLSRRSTFHERDPEQQAQMLAQLKIFAKSDFADGWYSRESRLESMIGIFENAVLREFEQGYEAEDYDGRMRRYAQVLVTLNGGAAGVDIYIQNHPLMVHKERLGNPLDCVRDAPIGGISPGPSYEFFRSLSISLNEQAGVIDRVFPDSVDVLTPFLSRLCEEIVADYLTALLDEAHQKGVETYVVNACRQLIGDFRAFGVIEWQELVARINFAEVGGDLISFWLVTDNDLRENHYRRLNQYIKMHLVYIKP